MNTPTDEIAAAEAAYRERSEHHAATLARFEEAHTALRNAIERRERLQAMAAAAEAQAAEHKDEWTRRIREAGGELTAEIKKVRRQQRDSEDLAEEYRAMHGDCETIHARAEYEALAAARAMEDARCSALVAWSELEMRRALAEALPSLTKAYRIAAIAHAPQSVIAARFHLGPSASEAALDRIKRAILAHAADVTLDAEALPPALARKRSIAPLRWDDAQSMIGMSRRRKALTEAAA